jgi:hypothetical protein
MSQRSHGLAACAFILILCSAASSESQGDSLTSWNYCHTERRQLSAVLQESDELERKLRTAQRKVLEQQRALSTCERSPSTARYNESQHLPTGLVAPKYVPAQALEGAHVARAGLNPLTLHLARCGTVTVMQVQPNTVERRTRSLLQAGIAHGMASQPTRYPARAAWHPTRTEWYIWASLGQRTPR